MIESGFVAVWSMTGYPVPAVSSLSTGASVRSAHPRADSAYETRSPRADSPDSAARHARCVMARALDGRSGIGMAASNACVYGCMG